MSEQVPPADDANAGTGDQSSTTPASGAEWNPADYNEVGDLHGYGPSEPSGPGAPPPPVPPTPPAAGWGTPGTPPPASWGSPGTPPPPEWASAPQTPTPPPVPQTPGWTPAPTTGLYYGTAPQFGTIPLRPLGLGEVIEGTFKTFRRYPGPIFTFGFILAVVQALLFAPLIPLLNKSNLLQGLQDWLNKHPNELPSHWKDISATPLSWFGWWALAVVVGSCATYLIGTLAYSHVAGEAAIGTSVTASEVWKLTRRQLWRGIGIILLLILLFGSLGLLFSLGAAFATILPTVGGVLAVGVIVAMYVVFIVMALRFTLAPAVLALEDVGPLTALRRSYRLVRGSSWRVFGYFIVAYLIAGAMSFAVSVPFSILSSLDSGVSIGGTATDQLLHLSTFSMFMQLLGQVVGTAVTLPFIYVFLAYMYTDLRMRRENLAAVLAAAAEKRHR